jgi:hypothetical protein
MSGEMTLQLVTKELGDYAPQLVLIITAMAAGRNAPPALQDVGIELRRLAELHGCTVDKLSVDQLTGVAVTPDSPLHKFFHSHQNTHKLIPRDDVTSELRRKNFGLVKK